MFISIDPYQCEETTAPPTLSLSPTTSPSKGPTVSPTSSPTQQPTNPPTEPQPTSPPTRSVSDSGRSMDLVSIYCPSDTLFLLTRYVLFPPLSSSKCINSPRIVQVNLPHHSQLVLQRHSQLVYVLPTQGLFTMVSVWTILQ